ncbi:rod shape-determining protein MreD [Virgibacillus xinjiangensis]|uniref:Rod shape-determining protein MreD n=1 Tax=Virgibacillus xinjiangensis TaxID=393090 RepID=A0ABV7CUJ8_9BACI
MKRLYVPGILFLLTISEGVALDLLPPGIVSGDYLIIPHWVLIFLVMLAIFYDKESTYYSVLYALAFGFLIDIVYTGILGVYMFSYAAAVYLAHGLKKILHDNILTALLLGMLGIVAADIFIYVIYMIVGTAAMIWENYLMYRLLPTVLANLFFLIIFYPIIVKRLEKWSEMQVFDRNRF